MLIEDGGRDFSTLVSGFCGSSALPLALGFFFCLSEDLRPACANVRSDTRKLLAIKAAASVKATATASFSFQLRFVLDCLFIAVPLFSAVRSSRHLTNSISEPSDQQAPIVRVKLSIQLTLAIGSNSDHLW